MLEMLGDIAIGLVLFIVGVLLFIIGIPKHGVHPALSSVRSVARSISGCHHGVSNIGRSDDA